MLIFLVGYMASGKTTLGLELAKSLSVPFIDIDEYIEKKEGKTISQIFEDKGETYFRRLEHDCLKEIILLSNAVVSTGGGLPCFNDNMKLINDAGISIYLEASVKELVDRLLLMGESRPLVRGKSREELYDYINKHLGERIKWYEMASDRCNVNDFNVFRLVKEIKELL